MVRYWYGTPSACCTGQAGERGLFGGFSLSSPFHLPTSSSSSAGRGQRKPVGSTSFHLGTNRGTLLASPPLTVTKRFFSYFKGTFSVFLTAVNLQLDEGDNYCKCVALLTISNKVFVFVCLLIEIIKSWSSCLIFTTSNNT